jgi:ribonuclease HII
MTNQFLDKYNNFIGVDETGVGDYFSPIISVACFVLPQNIDKLLELKVNDSKKLSDNYILQIAPEIKKLVK